MTIMQNFNSSYPSELHIYIVMDIIRIVERLMVERIWGRNIVLPRFRSSLNYCPPERQKKMGTIILEDIRSKLYDTNKYLPSNKFYNVKTVLRVTFSVLLSDIIDS